MVGGVLTLVPKVPHTSYGGASGVGDHESSGGHLQPWVRSNPVSGLILNHPLIPSDHLPPPTTFKPPFASAYNFRATI